MTTLGLKTVGWRWLADRGSRCWPLTSQAHWSQMQDFSVLRNARICRGYASIIVIRFLTLVSYHYQASKVPAPIGWMICFLYLQSHIVEHTAMLFVRIFFLVYRIMDISSEANLEQYVLLSLFTVAILNRNRPLTPVMSVGLLLF